MRHLEFAVRVPLWLRKSLLGCLDATLNAVRVQWQTQYKQPCGAWSGQRDYCPIDLNECNAPPAPAGTSQLA